VTPDELPTYPGCGCWAMAPTTAGRVMHIGSPGDPFLDSPYDITSLSVKFFEMAYVFMKLCFLMNFRACAPAPSKESRLRLFANFVVCPPAPGRQSGLCFFSYFRACPPAPGRHSGHLTTASAPIFLRNPHTNTSPVWAGKSTSWLVVCGPQRHLHMHARESLM
jgi:hypothetical protein